MSASFVSLSNIIIDDIVLHDGRTFMGILGGAGIHALSGMRPWTKAELGLVAAVGDDFARAHIQKFSQMSISFEGIFFRKNRPTTRAWQIIEADERRIEIIRSDEFALPGYQPSIDEIPQSFLSASGYHLHLDEQLDMFAHLLAYLKEKNPAATIIWEPTVPVGKFEPAHLEEILSLVSIFSPSLGEARLITGLKEEKEILSYLFDHGAERIALRMGSKGSLVYAHPGQGVKIPAIAKSIVDVTGAGNAYCGGFLVAIAQGLSVEEAGLRGAVSGSFEIEQFGVPERFDEDIREEAHKRLEELRCLV